MALAKIPPSKSHKRTALLTCRRCGFFQDFRSISLHVLGQHVDTKDAPYHCLLCRARYIDLDRLQVHVRSAAHRAHLMIATPDEVSNTLGRVVGP